MYLHLPQIADEQIWFNLNVKNIPLTKYIADNKKILCLFFYILNISN